MHPHECAAGWRRAGEGLVPKGGLGMTLGCAPVLSMTHETFAVRPVGLSSKGSSAAADFARCQRYGDPVDQDGLVLLGFLLLDEEGVRLCLTGGMPGTVGLDIGLSDREAAHDRPGQVRIWAAYRLPTAVARVPRRSRRVFSGRCGWRRTPR